MSYLVLARKYRPANFAQLVGQEHVVQALSNALKTGRLHHAWLFTGTRGVGKTTVSRILAKSLNCRGPDGRGGVTDTPCGVCDACRDIDAGRFVDYTELDAASNRGVDEVQSLLEQAVYKPVQGRFKVFMIDEVHMLTGHAFNAMLKTLEEPPEYLKFVLATTDPQKVPVTVLSRCLQFNLRPMAPQTVRLHLAQVLENERIEAEPAALALIARAARGSMRDALSLTDQAIAFGAGRLEEDAVRQMLGSADRTHVVRLIEALAQGDGRAVLDVVAALRRQGLSAAATLEDMSERLQRMAVCQAVPDGGAQGLEMEGDAATLPESEAAQTARLAALMPADETQLLYSICLHGRAELGLAPDEYSGLTMVLLRLLAFKPPAAATGSSVPAQKKTASTEDDGLHARRQSGVAVARAMSSSALAGSGPAPHEAVAPRELCGATGPQIDDTGPAEAAVVAAAPAPAVAPCSSEPSTSGARSADGRGPADDDAFWHETVQQLVAEDRILALVRELALQSQLVSRTPSRWLLRVESASLNQPTVRERLALALAAAGHAVALEVETGVVTDSPARRNAAAAIAAQREAEQRIQSDPFVQAMMREFGARIVPGSVKPVRASAPSRPAAVPDPAGDDGAVVDNPAVNS